MYTYIIYINTYYIYNMYTRTHTHTHTHTQNFPKLES